MENTRAYLTVPQVAELLGLHPESVRKMARSGNLPAFKAGRGWRFDPVALNAWRQNQHAKGAPAPRVLVVDDAAHVRDVIRLTLEEVGHEVVLAETGQGARTALTRRRPDLLILDLKLPGGSGVDVLRALREAGADTPVIIVTGYPDSDLMQQAMDFAPFVVLPKPVAPDVLLQAVHGALGATPLRSPLPPVERAPAVLIIDDDELIRKLLSRMLGELGYRALTAATAEEGLQRVGSDAPDAVLLDLVLPDMNGPRFLELLRECHPGLPVVLVTGYPDGKLAEMAMRHAPILLLAKPVEPALLGRTLASILTDKHQPRRNASVQGGR